LRYDFCADVFTARRNARIPSAVLATAIPSVCPSVRPSHAGIVSKRRHVARCSLDCRIAKCVSYCRNPKIFPRDDPFPLEILAPCPLGTGFPTSHPPRFYAAPNFLKMGINMPGFVVFWTTSTIKDEKSAAKFHYIKNCQRQCCSAINCLWSGINILARGRPVPPEILPPSDLPSPVNGIIWEMSELITQERIAIGSSNLVEGLIA